MTPIEKNLKSELNDAYRDVALVQKRLLSLEKKLETLLEDVRGTLAKIV